MRRTAIAISLSSAMFLLFAGPGPGGGGGEHGGPPNGSGGSKGFQKEFKNTGQQQFGGPGQVMKKLEAARTLQLTPQQQTQLSTLEREVRQQMVALRDEIKPQMQGGGAAGGGSDRRAMMQQFLPKIQAMQQQVNTGLNSILTPQQQTELNAKMQSEGGALAGGGFTKQMRHEGFGKGELGKQQAPGASVVSASPPPAPPAPPVTPAPPVAPSTSAATTSGGLGIVNPFTP